MSEPEIIPTEETQSEKSGGGGKMKLIIIVLAFLLIGGGGVGGYFLFLKKSPLPEGEETAEMTEEKEKKPKSKKKVIEEDEDEEEEDASGKPKSKESTSLKNAIPKDEDVKHIIELQPFIVNLADADFARYLRMTVSVGVGGEEGGGEEKADPIFITRVRNAMLSVLSVKTSEEVLSVEGKAKLRKELLKAAKAASEEPHVEAIYITDFIVQL